MEECDFTVTIVGLGLIGGSYGLALRKINYKNIFGVDVSPEALVKVSELISTPNTFL